MTGVQSEMRVRNWLFRDRDVEVRSALIARMN
jgi:hypothetical protein